MPARVTAFTIAAVPPGTYTVVASGVGFQRKRFTNVKVSVDFTTRLEIQLSVEAINLETVEVRAEAPMVRRDLTSSQSIVDATAIRALPVENVTQILSLQAGIIQGTGGELHIRGGRSTEILYTVNGTSIINPFDNSRSVTIATNSIEELSVVAGTFNAEYGNALSGVINTVTKEGSTAFHATLTGYTGDFASGRTDPFFNIDNFNAISRDEPVVGVEEVPEVVVPGDLAAEDRAVLAHALLEERMAHPVHERLAAVARHGVPDRVAGADVVDDPRSRVLDQERLGQERRHEVAGDELPGAVDEEATIGVAVPRDADVGPLGDHPIGDVVAVLLHERVGLVVGERPVHLEAQAGGPARKPVEQPRGDETRHAAARVEHGVERLDHAGIDEREDALDVVVEHVCPRAGVFCKKPFARRPS